MTEFSKEFNDLPISEQVKLLKNWTEIYEKKKQEFEDLSRKKKKGNVNVEADGCAGCFVLLTLLAVLIGGIYGAVNLGILVWNLF